MDKKKVGLTLALNAKCGNQQTIEVTQFLTLKVVQQKLLSQYVCQSMTVQLKRVS